MSHAKSDFTRGCLDPAMNVCALYKTLPSTNSASTHSDYLNSNTGILHDLIMAVVVDPMMRLRMCECP